MLDPQQGEPNIYEDIEMSKVSQYFNSMSPCLNLHVSMSPCLQTETELKEKGNFYLFSCKRKTETANFCLFAANGNGKFLFLGRQMIKGNRRLLFRKIPMVAEHIDRG
jgi:hypothetical protein